jgi:hypothetical protein
MRRQVIVSFIKELKTGLMDWTHVTQYEEKWPAFVNTVMKFRVQ